MAVIYAKIASLVMGNLPKWKRHVPPSRLENPTNTLHRLDTESGSRLPSHRRDVKVMYGDNIVGELTHTGSVDLKM